MRNKFVILYSLLFFSFFGYSQNELTIFKGEVTFLTNSNVYVRFENLDNIFIGDTLSLSQNGVLIPCLVIQKKSSSSAVCTSINDCKPPVKSVVIARIKPDVIEEKPSEQVVKKNDKPDELAIDKPIQDDSSELEGLSQTAYNQKIRAQISAASYSSFSDESDDRHRLMARFNLTANHINNSKFSLETYMNYRQNFIAGELQNEIQTKFFRVYNLALNYDVDSTFRVSIGRKINFKASSLGAIDGIQAEKKFGTYYVGAIAGFRPDFIQFDFNSDLFEYGVYTGRSHRAKNIQSTTTLGVLEQRNSGEVDRRYSYFQHSSTLYRKLNLFSSIELDLFENLNGQKSVSPRLTNFYLSARYRFSRKLSVTASYDSRKRIIYYETLQTDVERMLEDDESRQGVRLRLNVAPIKYVNLGLSYGKRFQSDQQNESNNINGYIGISKLPIIKGRLTANYNRNNSSYLTSNIYSFRHSRKIMKNLNLDMYFRNTNFKYINSGLAFTQNYYGLNLSYRLNKTITISALGELAQRQDVQNYRVNTRLIKRFGR